ncbi:MAG: twin-arginine translocase TatA/TatE family subunit [Bacteroidales bacterium]|jgi:TatA/E family protein of Tat protein translocase|nr:twin-arginine translocase TatA/TatE family subunit [Bacteroidales bacterium]
MISWGEIVVVFFIALLLFGADKIPDFARTAGKMMGEYRKVRDSLREEIDNVKEELDEVKTDLEKMDEDMEDDVEEIADEAYKDI